MQASKLNARPFMDPCVGLWLGEPQEHLPWSLRLEVDDFQVREIVYDPRFGRRVLTPGRKSDLAAHLSHLATARPMRYIAATLIERDMTTMGGVKGLAKAVGILPEKVTKAAFKDRRGVTTQLVCLDGADMEKVLAVWADWRLEERGWAIKDAYFTDRPLRKGQNLGNEFEILVKVPGWSRKKLDEYLKPRIDRLYDELDGRIPNAYGPQRFKGEGEKTGWELMVNGAEAGLRRLLFVPFACEPRDAAAKRAELAQVMSQCDFDAKLVDPACFDARLYFKEMKELLEEDGCHSRLSLDNHHSVVSAMAECADWNLALARLKTDLLVLWNSWQSWAFNVWLLPLAIKGMVPVTDGKVPLLVWEKETLRYYLRYCPQALPLLVDPASLDEKVDPLTVPMQVDPHVRDTLMRPEPTEESDGVPRRQVLVRVDDLEYETDENQVRFRFGLRAGSFATTALEAILGTSCDPCTSRKERERMIRRFERRRRDDCRHDCLNVVDLPPANGCQRMQARDPGFRGRLCLPEEGANGQGQDRAAS